MQRKNALGALFWITWLASFAGQVSTAQHKIHEDVSGRFEKDIYTSPELDFQIHAPKFAFEKWVSDSAGADGARRVVFRDSLGSYHSVLAFPISQGLTPDEALLLVSGVVHHKQAMQTPHGREWQVLSVLPGAGGVEFHAGVEKPLDVVAASAIFSAYGRTYRVSAGFEVMGPHPDNLEERGEAARSDLKTFLAGFRVNRAAPEDTDPHYLLRRNLASVFAKASMPITKEIQGTLDHDEVLYTSSFKDFQVRAPKPFRQGMAVRDQGTSDAHEVIFSDAFGSVYRVSSLSMANELTLEMSLRILEDPIQQHEIQSTRGREFRIVNVKRRGAEACLNVAAALETSKTVVPDLVIANAVFIANARIYHVSVGTVSFDDSGTQAASEVARTRLEKFLAGFKALENKN
jgi:hypothetical protein